MSNVYQPPESNLIKDNEQVGRYGSIEKAVSGDYEFSIGGVLGEAWDKVGGSKWQFVLASIFYFLVSIVLMVAMSVVSLVLPASGSGSGEGGAIALIVSMLVQVGFNLIMIPIAMGIVMMGVRRSMDVPVEATSVFSYYSRMIPLFLTSILMMIMILIGLLLLVLPGIYLMFAYYMALPLVVEKGMGPWQALETSRKAISKRWFSMAALFMLMGIIVTISAIPLGIGLIWTIPMMMIAYGVLYRNMFGVEAETLA